LDVTKEMLGIQTRKKILYLDQSFLSMAFRKDTKWEMPMGRIKDLLNLQLLVVPYSPTHEEETHFWVERRDDLLKFIYAVARGHKFEPYYRVERTQILKAFQAFLANAPAPYVREERDALPSSVHDWDGRFAVSVHRPVLEGEVKRRRGFKQQAADELVKVLDDWTISTNTFEQDMEIERRDCVRIFIEHYERKASRLWAGDFSALLDSPMSADIVEDMLYILRLQGSAQPIQTVGFFFGSKHFAGVPSRELSARLFSAFKKRVREGAFPNRQKALEKLKGVLFDVQHAATYAPYCDAFFADRFMADLLNDPNVAVEQTFGCKIFSVARWPEFFRWLDNVKSSMTAEHLDGLSWAYPNYRPKGIVTANNPS
jgi:hypothetical protein